MERHGVHTEKNVTRTNCSLLSVRTNYKKLSESNHDAKTRSSVSSAPPSALRCQVWSVWRANLAPSVFEPVSKNFRFFLRSDTIAVAISFSSFSTALCFPWRSARDFRYNSCMIHVVQTFNSGASSTESSGGESRITSTVSS